jgi:hypothetical protein
MPGHFVRVGSNDTLGEISKRAYGTVRRVADIQRANPGTDPVRLRPGALLYVPMGDEPTPPAPGTDAVARTPAPRPRPTLAAPARGP